MAVVPASSAALCNVKTGCRLFSRVTWPRVITKLLTTTTRVSSYIFLPSSRQTSCNLHVINWETFSFSTAAGRIENRTYAYAQLHSKERVILNGGGGHPIISAEARGCREGAQSISRESVCTARPANARTLSSRTFYRGIETNADVEIQLHFTSLKIKKENTVDVLRPATFPWRIKRLIISQTFSAEANNAPPVGWGLEDGGRHE